jgi:predicted metal-dependent enzyme (double-stranded beta helix superfamily)
VSVMSERHAAVQNTLSVVRALGEELGPTDDLIDALKPVLIELGLRSDLFPPETFAVTPGGTMTIYELSADPGETFGLYASAGLPGKYQPPHDHRTWSLIAGVRGAEHNKYFERTTGGDDFDTAELAPTGELVIRSGMANGMLGHLFHSIEVIEDEPALHLHLYGDTLDSLQGRIFFESEVGGVAKPFMSKPNLHTALVTVEELVAMRADGDSLDVVDGRDDASTSCGGSVGQRCVVVADDDPAAHAVAHGLRRAGVLNIAVLHGGVSAWIAAGHDVDQLGLG